MTHQPKGGHKRQGGQAPPKYQATQKTQAQHILHGEPLTLEGVFVKLHDTQKGLIASAVIIFAIALVALVVGTISYITLYSEVKTGKVCKMNVHCGPGLLCYDGKCADPTNKKE
jgi:hypothetical protein